MADTVVVKLPKRFYTVEQLAERWGCKVEDINHLIETEMLEFVHKGALRTGHKYIRVIASPTEEECVRCINEQNHPTVLYRPVINPFDPAEVSNEEVVRMESNQMRQRGEFDRVITAAEVSRYEREHGQHEKSFAGDESHQLENRNTPEHPCYSEELAAAVAAWTELYSGSNGAKPKGGHKKLITDWVRNAYPTLSNEAVSRIATLVNPDKKGGASATP